MATVTKLKSVVNNSNLPVLGNDGNLYSYYVGRWVNGVSELGYTPSQSEVNALNAFIENGKNNEWLDDILYFLPFIGSGSNPISGLVPLIDGVANYVLSESTITPNVFTVENNKIIGFGNTGLSDAVNIKLPLKTNDYQGNLNGLSVYFNINYKTSDLSNYERCQIINCIDTNNTSFLGMMRGNPGTSRNALISNRRASSNSQFVMVYSYPNETGVNITEQCQLGVYNSVYYDTDNLCKSNVYVMKKGSDVPLREAMSNSETSDTFYKDIYDIVLGGHSTPPNAVINCLAIVNPHISSQKINLFNKAVFALTTAIDR